MARIARVRIWIAGPRITVHLIVTVPNAPFIDGPIKCTEDHLAGLHNREGEIELRF
jgi:hypothetical protein